MDVELTPRNQDASDLSVEKKRWEPHVSRRSSSGSHLARDSAEAAFGAKNTVDSEDESPDGLRTQIGEATVCTATRVRVRVDHSAVHT